MSRQSHHSRNVLELFQISAGSSSVAGMTACKSYALLAAHAVLMNLKVRPQMFDSLDLVQRPEPLTSQLIVQESLGSNAETSFVSADANAKERVAESLQRVQSFFRARLHVFNKH